MLVQRQRRRSKLAARDEGRASGIHTSVNGKSTVHEDIQGSRFASIVDFKEEDPVNVGHENHRIYTVDQSNREVTSLAFTGELPRQNKIKGPNNSNGNIKGVGPKGIRLEQAYVGEGSNQSRYPIKETTQLIRDRTINLDTQQDRLTTPTLHGKNMQRSQATNKAYLARKSDVDNSNCPHPLNMIIGLPPKPLDLAVVERGYFDPG